MAIQKMQNTDNTESVSLQLVPYDVHILSCWLSFPYSTTYHTSVATSLTIASS